LRNRIRDEYFKWLCDLVSENRFSKNISFTKLLTRLHDTAFIYVIPRDQNRAGDGIDLRYRFATRRKYVGQVDEIMSILNGPCTVLEMMVALATRCEETIMEDTDVGNRTGQWFWGMVTNLGLGSMTDIRYDERYIDDVLTRFLNREYEPDGTGGLFTIRRCDRDLRKVEIWHQLCWYLDSMM
jgi:hypothetical protein